MTQPSPALRTVDGRPPDVPTLASGRPTSPVTPTRSPSSSADTVTGSGRSHCVPPATARKRLTPLQDGADLGVSAGRDVPRRRAGHHVAAPDRRQRLPGPDAPSKAPPDRGAARRRGPGGASSPSEPRRRSGRGQRAAGRCDGRARPSSPTSSGPRSSWSTWRGTPSTTPPRSSACAPGTVKSRCSRGRARLVPLLTQYRRAHGGDEDHGVPAEGPARSRNHHDPAPSKPMSPRDRPGRTSPPTALPGAPMDTPITHGRDTTP